MKRVTPLIGLVLLLILASATLVYSGAPAPGSDDSPPTAAEARLLGILDYSGTRDPIVSPATVRAGEQFPVTISTYGGGCERKGDEGVVTGESSATVMVYDYTSAIRPDIACTAILKRLTHTVTLRLTK